MKCRLPNGRFGHTFKQATKETGILTPIKCIYCRKKSFWMQEVWLGTSHRRADV